MERNVFSEFVQICEKNNLFYSLAFETSLSWNKGEKIDQKKHIFQVFMSIDSYRNLKKKFYNNVIDNSNSINYNFLKPRFVLDKSNWINEVSFVEINILIPSTLKKIKSFKSLKNLFIYQINKKNKEIKNSSLFKKIFNLFPININKAIYSIYSSKHQGFFVLSNVNENTEKNWFLNITFKTKEIQFLNLKTRVIEEIESHFKRNYKDGYNKIIF
ncbi:unknown; predicted coding region [Mycoplasmopsis pulmonis]|uniref:Uncharacterized protein n=1 Tax=Mycoplasmopsis pulmonis (strain UAB CTIP) TaxID=272635 RepID=Q98RK3_MYCPU|nr:hypothetical protein [Mycoplasmopsis pulmonis]MDZ7293371.1 hypothetical protein [Mycoplasmopsis pulmonis]CAC13178.1 unknown; predicted coding region [Mycoplasmopsis pulmonis]VEU67798.1 Uncharacterised protein [Mycoplasmopsis pulmonis]